MPAPVLVPQANGDLPSNVFVPPGEEDDSEDSDSDEEEDEHDEVKTVKAVHNYTKLFQVIHKILNIQNGLSVLLVFKDNFQHV